MSGSVSETEKLIEQLDDKIRIMNHIMDDTKRTKWKEKSRETDKANNAEDMRETASPKSQETIHRTSLRNYHLFPNYSLNNSFFYPILY